MMKTFKDLGLNPDILKRLEELDFIEPTPIQAETIPFLLNSKQDLIGLAQTGTGKTAGFGLPILDQLKNEKGVQAIILCPTRELCLQISKDMESFSKYSKKAFITPVYGGERIDIQIRALKRGSNIVVGTPGRVCDLIRRNVLKLGQIKWLVLDEADEMLDMGFKDDLDAILSEIPENKQTLLFSATMSASVGQIAKKYMKKSHEISVGEKNSGAKNVSHEYYVVKAGDRFDALTRIIDSLPGIYGILFCRTRRETQDVADKLKKIHYSAEAIHGEISQGARTKIMDRFRQGRIKLLVATDVAARGIDVSDLTHIINYNLPDSLETYTHRSGRTGRATKKGISILIVSATESRKIPRLESLVGQSFVYKKIPTGGDIFNKQLKVFIDEIKNTKFESVETDNGFKKILDGLEEVTKEDLVKYIVSQKMSRFVGENKKSDTLDAVKPGKFSNGEDGENMVRFKINFGKQNGFDIKSLFSLINSNNKLKGIEIGRIDLLADHSFFSVESNYAQDVVSSLDGSNFKGKKIALSKADSKKNNSGFRSGGRGASSRKFGNDSRKRKFSGKRGR